MVISEFLTPCNNKILEEVKDTIEVLQYTTAGYNAILAPIFQRMIADDTSFTKLQRVIQRLQNTKTILEKGTSTRDFKSWLENGRAKEGVVRISLDSKKPL